MSEFNIGQKWISNAEPELGMGEIIELDFRSVLVHYPRADERRTYASKQAPLTRVKFSIGDEISNDSGQELIVKDVSIEDGLYNYSGSIDNQEIVIAEPNLNPNLQFSKPEDRLFTHQFDQNDRFNLRYHTLIHQAELAASNAQGLYGPRISLIPHQLYIANEVASRFAPRVLLADEVGLGKTIEAGAIIHQQLTTHRAKRVLIVVPPALTFQWFVEMIRRFNLHFTVMDEDRCQNIIVDNTDANFIGSDEDDSSEYERSSKNSPWRFNPFEAHQLMLCSLDLFLDNPTRLEQAMATDWDLMVVDEAHHLTWTEHQASAEYQVVEHLSNISKGLLLLTATPEQLGKAGHFARLRLLDPTRYHDYDAFVSEESRFETIADNLDLLRSGEESETTSASHQENGAREKILELLSIKESADHASLSTDDLVNMVLDRHGTGRVLFRNVRGSVKGFPNRILKRYALETPEAYRQFDSLYPETKLANWTKVDPRIEWLKQLVGSRTQDKFLLICAHQQTALDLEANLSKSTTIRLALFHEGMDLVARDRAANYFSETERGAQLLICSEIGSEGRNFQFASNIILFDLPAGPDLLEQRIGRLDRIGQKNDVTIHAPVLESTAQASLLRIYDQGLGIFTSPNPVAQNVFDELVTDLSTSNLDQQIASLRTLNDQKQKDVQNGRDRLLELNSHRPDVSKGLIADIQENQGGAKLSNYMERSFDAWGLESEPLEDDVILVKPTLTMARNDSISVETLDHNHYPELPEDGIRITYDRNVALSREDVNFLTWENPIVQQALDLVATDIIGNSTMIAVKHDLLPAGTILLEALYLVNCVAPAELMIDKYIPPAVIRVVLAPNLTDITENLSWSDLSLEKLEIGNEALGRILDSQQQGVRKMLTASRSIADKQLEHCRVIGIKKATTAYDLELNRLIELRKVNRTIRDEEIAHFSAFRQLTLEVIQQATARLDAVRVIVAA
ncbi:MAG: ATP-dependent helicase HepA [Candidatus Azotimanducaceae bacterium]|jgi:ATP-dependent helicase HepA